MSSVNKNETFEDLDKQIAKAEAEVERLRKKRNTLQDTCSNCGKSFYKWELDRCNICGDLHCYDCDPNDNAPDCRKCGKISCGWCSSICQECDERICYFCDDGYASTCSECLKKNKREDSGSDDDDDDNDYEDK